MLPRQVATTGMNRSELLFLTILENFTVTTWSGRSRESRITCLLELFADYPDIPTFIFGLRKQDLEPFPNL